MMQQRLASLFCLSSLLVLGSAFIVTPIRNHDGLTTTTALDMSTTAAIGDATNLKSILKKPSKVLTVGVDCDVSDNNNIDQLEIAILSMQLRKSKVSSIWCSNLQAVKEFSAEQESAKGSFPGPLPIIYSGSAEDCSAALENGASAVVLSSEDDPSTAGENAEVVWKVSSLEQVKKVLEATADAANVFLVDMPASDDEEQFEAIVQALPKTSLCIASVEPMQEDGAEIEIGKNLKKVGCGSVLVRSAIVGDPEDLPYAQFLVEGLTSKASSEFKFTGLTGSTNGHFGGVQANGTVKWRRVEEQQ
mmetsp:Transcript_11832/g.28291  ORF Transcript_11832/g.28291 Transcript_11832/m.28291 type:complete len:304 (-) Transcript_11832:272-1183(-)|eukprot:CAMPEP_0113619176 /NCGR_PEP_ID=MMETSP0017_2-20120614/9728_1 /TAXON_ID=2856 /ORGANISM="Cylindrotheca closterium" /LENGTH=303 /DNA_ID=CAMNT_0000528729 /DNA_START=20 /DNA_END=931 /DNA_ORIENTATION=- /assembly_acc=CAM_ASM_000147